jgi:hypothetical protein
MYKLITQQTQVDALASSKKIADLGGFNATAFFTAYQTYLQIYINGISRKNFAYSFNSISSYDYSADVPNNQGVKQRQLDKCQYVFPGVQNVGDIYDLNNWNRESSVYTKTIETRPTVGTIPALPYPNQSPSLYTSGVSEISDNSRFTISQANNCGTPEFQQPIKVVSYYGSIKNINNGQYGQIYSYQTIDTGFQRIFDALPNNDSEVIFGGDTYIGKFGFKTKLPFFIDNRVGAPDDSDIYYDEIGNIAYPQYWYSARSVLSDYTVGSTVMKNIISTKAHYLDCPNDAIVDNISTTTSSSTTPTPGTVTAGSLNYSYDGKMYLFAYGIPYYYVESSINVDLRQAFNNLEGDFYPHVSSGIPDTWFQESRVPIVLDNTYYYNTTFSKQNTENFFSHLPSDWVKQLCFTYFPFRAIYSDPQESYSDNRINSWLIYRPISFFDFPQNYGKLISLDGIQNRATLARFENKTLLYGNMLTINTSNPQVAYLGNPSLFGTTPPVDYAETDLGYVGCQNKFLLKIPNGQITVDAKRGQIFLIQGTQAMDISGFGSGLNRFFTDHLAFEILRYFPTINIDNHFNGVGLHGVFDSKFERIIITKLDYIPQPGKQIYYDEIAQKFYINQPVAGNTSVKTYVNLTDVNYFCNKSWTVSFNLNTKSWVSFHTYIPNFYIGENNFYYSGLNEGCNLTAVAVVEIPSPTTTTTTTRAQLNCALNGTAVYVPPPTTTTTTSSSTSTSTTTSTTSTTSTTTTVPPLCTLVPGSFTTAPECTLVAGEFIYVAPVTTTTTTSIPPTTTTTTTPQPSLYRYSSAGPEDACTTGLEMNNVVLIGGTFCDATAIQCDEFVLEIAGLPVYIRTGNSYRTATINDPNTSGIATFDAGTCIVCTTTTTTTTGLAPAYIESIDTNDVFAGECFCCPNEYETVRTYTVTFTAAATGNGNVNVTYLEGANQSTIPFSTGATYVSWFSNCGCLNICYTIASAYITAS